jgi:hypothetical protein
MKMPIWIIVCSVLLASPGIHAGEGMSREPGPGKKIEKTLLGDGEIKQLLVGNWVDEDKISDIYVVKRTFTFAKDGSYKMKRVSSISSPQETNVKGKWTVQEGVLTLTPTDPKGEKDSLYGQFTAYTIMKISDSTLEWQVDWEHSDASPAVIRSTEITTHKRVK